MHVKMYCWKSPALDVLYERKDEKNELALVDGNKISGVLNEKI
jgi:hypothetical protein